MATHGHIGQFDRGVEDWMAYCERLQQYFLANDVANADKQRAILLSVCGPATYQLPFQGDGIPLLPQEGTPGQSLPC